MKPLDRYFMDLSLCTAEKAPGRMIDGPYANWATQDEQAQVVLTNNSTLKLGQPLCLDVTQLGPDNNVPNNSAQLPTCERLVITTNANAGPIFGVISGIPGGAQSPQGLTPSFVNGFTGATQSTGGVTTWTNKTGSTLTVTVIVRQLGWGYVWAGTAAIGQTGGNSILVGSNLIVTTAQAFAIQGTATISNNIGTALASVINTTQSSTAPGATAAGVVSVLPASMVGVVPNAIVLIDSLGSGVQEAVSVGSISYPTFAFADVNAHASGYKITGPATNPAKNSVLISTPGAGVTVNGLVATWINIQA